MKTQRVGGEISGRHTAYVPSREILAYYDQWWFDVADTGHGLFYGATEAIFKAAQA